MAVVALSCSRALEVMEVDACELDLGAPRSIRFDLVDGQLARHGRMQGFATSVTAEEHESKLVCAVVALAVGDVRVVVLTVDLDIGHVNLDGFALTSGLKADTFLIINENHVVHSHLLRVIHRGQTTVPILVSAEVASFVAGAARSQGWVRVDVGTDTLAGVCHVVPEDH